MPDSEFKFSTPPSVKTEPEAPAPAMEKVEEPLPEPNPVADKQMYVAPTAPNLIVKIPKPDGGTERFQFKKGQLEIPIEFVDAFDKLLQQSEGLKPLVRKVDLAAAKAMVAELEAKHSPQAASKGTFTSSSAMMRQNLENINAQLDAAGVGDKTYVEELGAMSMQMLEVTNPPVDAKIIDPRAKPKD